MQKNVISYVLDTNVLLSSPDAIYGFEEHNVIIPGTVLQELDLKKKTPGEIGHNARKACRILDEERKRGDIRDGVKIKSGGTLIVEPDGVKQELLPDGFYISNPDNRIISTCLYLQKKHSSNNNQDKSKITLVTNDVSLRVNATICGINVEDYRNLRTTDDVYRGWRRILVSEEVINGFYETGKLNIETICGDWKDVDTEETNFLLLENEYVMLTNGDKKSALAIHKSGECERIDRVSMFNNTAPLNFQQIFATNALLAPASEIPLVVLCGPAGTAKTYLSLAAGLEKTYTGNKNREYRKIIITRPNNITTDPGLGYLPGDLDDKMGPLIAPYIDNLEAILSGVDGEEQDQLQIQIDDMFENGIIEITALSYIRGRSFTNSFVICDESQNANASLIRDVVTRCGRGTKIVLAGDLEQIDAPTLDARSSGLAHVIDKMKESPLCAIVKFDANHSVRSDLAKDAISRM